MKLFSWLQDNVQFNESEDAEPPLSPVLQARLEELEKLTVKEIMTPRAVVTALDVDVQLRRVRRLKSSKAAYFPVYKGDLDQILGWVSKTRVLELLDAPANEENPLLTAIRPVGSVAEDVSVGDLADHFLKAASPFLVVRNAQGTTVGIVFLSEFVELIFGFEMGPEASPVPTEAPAPAARGYEV